ncbi:MAG: YdcF family protein [Candidatus Levybacteria bacterium]|nr:YdcF family protein [Candidatus Levybacteria bacterium]
MLSVPTTESGEDSHTYSQSSQFSYDTVIVFGQGPVKPVLLENEITPKQLHLWQAYKNDPTHSPEPGFWLMQQPRHLAELEKIRTNSEMTAKEKFQNEELIRQKWQKMGWFAMKHWCRQNALAAGLALYKGLTKKIILSGGRTIRSDVKKLLPQERFENWPSEAELMADVIRSTYGDLYLKKYGHSIDEKICIEDSSNNTLENFACTVNKYPELLRDDVHVGFLAVEHHLDRVVMFGKLFSIKGSKLCAQQMLKTMRTELQGNQNQEYIEATDKFVEDQTIVTQEKRWRRGVMEPEYLAYWLGYVAMVKHPRVLNNIMQKFDDPTWGISGERTFAKIGLKLSDYQGRDMLQLAANDATTFNYLTTKLQELRKPENRTFPPNAAEID